jgi:hypothetical protein
MRTRLLFLASTLVSTVAALGCGSLDGHTGKPGALATVQGDLVDPSGYGVHNDVRVAVVWLNVDGKGYSVSQDLPVQPVFPSSFVVQLDGPPPAAALATLPQLDNVPVAQGVVVDYEDLNGNGQLDLVPSSAGAFIDRVVGANEQLSLAYFGGPVPPQATQNSVGTPTPGYDLLQVQPPDCPTGWPGSSSGAASSSSSGAVSISSSGSSSGAGPSFDAGPSSSSSSSSTGSSSSSGAATTSSSSSGSGSMAGTEAGAPEAGVASNDGDTNPDAPFPGCQFHPAEWLPITTAYVLTVSSDPMVNQIMCQNGGSSNQPSGGTGGGYGWDVGTQGTPPGGYPSPTDPDLRCESSTSYMLTHCTTVQQGLCGPIMTNCMSISVSLGTASPPPGWPCP